MTRSYVVDSLNLMISATFQADYEVREFNLLVVLPDWSISRIFRLRDIMHSYRFAHQQAYPRQLLLVSKNESSNPELLEANLKETYPETNFHFVSLSGSSADSVAALGQALIDLGIVALAEPKESPHKLIYETPGTL